MRSKRVIAGRGVGGTNTMPEHREAYADDFGGESDTPRPSSRVPWAKDSNQKYLKCSDEEEIGKTCLAQRRPAAGARAGKGRQGDGPRPVIPSECEGSKKDDFSLCSKQGFLPEPALSMAEGVKMTRGSFFACLAFLRLGSGHAWRDKFSWRRSVQQFQG